MAEKENSNSPLQKIPRHVAIIMDGNGRWARKRHLPRVAGHRVGLEAVRKTIKGCIASGVEALTLFAFSSENWRRPKDEVGVLMNLFLSALQSEVKKLDKNGVRLRVIGDISAFNEELQQRIIDSEALTRNNDRLCLNIAANYGGRWDITQACRYLAGEVVAGRLQSGQITPELIRQQLSLSDLPEPDLFIRTGGEQRISNFLLWQLAYTELYFTDLLWPEFDEQALTEAFASYAGRQRRFGRTGEQVEQGGHA
ncbi:MAG: isoprenyl transferase [Gammaproteobacteria bacterium]|nr:isoprenyl transferase [Gammaproteobacteria bacterium]MCW8840685.1 isoprenyl transferase [Gammaproteobacteria bacterium]MCW8927672.1 isoprenyl transferase [Gammaproteobacteria bacterium]MCW8959050.1 isoprenyl transferase [Gammaproteobacteria bacterium]MCW8973141.1 isoprenyl transferase [Gammaproteobacteria bacterium]